jgi:Protein of unknown function (DUF1498).
MKRSEINAVIKRFEKLLAEYKFALPPFLSFTPEEWKTKGHEYDEIRENMLGWDVTDYGMGDFKRLGLALITIRNGNANNPKKYPKVYAEKIMMCEPGQVSPMHFHWKKMEDIINRGGGVIEFTLYNATEDGELADTDVEIFQDGRHYTVPAGSKIILHPGESLTLYPYCYHEFVIPENSGPVLIGEVSMCNDDNNDNRFLKPIGRFPTIEEDEPPYRLLCNEYPPAKD